MDALAAESIYPRSDSTPRLKLRGIHQKPAAILGVSQLDQTLGGKRLFHGIVDEQSMQPVASSQPAEGVQTIGKEVREKADGAASSPQGQTEEIRC